MKRSLFVKLCYIIVLVAIFLAAVYITREGKEEADIVSAFTDNSFAATYSQAEVAALFDSEYLKEEEKKLLLAELAELLGITSGYEYKTEKEGSKTISAITADGGVWKAVIEFITNEKSGGYNVINLEQYVKVIISIKDSPESTLYYQGLMEDAFKEKGLEPEKKLSVCGEIDSFLNEDEKWNIAERFINKLNGSIVAKDISENNYAIYGYTKEIEEFVVYGSSKINLTLIIEEDEKNGVTSVYMATPTIE